jgi:hypothetical protein
VKEFKLKLTHLHRQTCGENCSHLKQYISNFAKYREEAKERLKMHVENLHQSIESPQELPQLRKKK